MRLVFLVGMEDEAHQSYMFFLEIIILYPMICAYKNTKVYSVQELEGQRRPGKI